MSLWDFVNKLYRCGCICSSRGLSKAPQAVSDLTELEKINLSGNYLKELLTSINKLKNFKMLRLDKN